jgi:hypothetical protein
MNGNVQEPHLDPEDVDPGLALYSFFIGLSANFPRQTCEVLSN